MENANETNDAHATAVNYSPLDSLLLAAHIAALLNP